MNVPFILLYIWWSMLMSPFQTVRIPGPGGIGSGGGGSPPTYVNGGGDFTGGGSLTTGWSPSNGNTLVVWSYANDSTTTHTCSDGEGTGNTYIPDGVITNGTSIVGRIFHAKNISGSGAYTITCTGTTPVVTAIEYSGGSGDLDTTSSGSNPSSTTGSCGTCTPSAFTPTTAATILVDGFGSPTGATVTLVQVDTNYTIRASALDGTSQFVGAIGTRVVSSSASYSDGWTMAPVFGAEIAINAAYK